MNEKHMKGIRHILERLPSQQIWTEATAELDAILEAAAKAKTEREAKQETAARTPNNPWAGWKPKAA
jgi:hypothetical protein